MLIRDIAARVLTVWCALALSGNIAAAQSPGPMPVTTAMTIPAPKDIPYPGAITLSVDATDLDRHVFSVRESIPVSGGGPLVLLYPQWLPGQHGPNGRIDKLAGLTIHAGNTRVEWTRDPGDIFAFHVDVPAGATVLDLEFQYMSALDNAQGRMAMSPDMLDLSWDSVVLYPAGFFARQISVVPLAHLPDGWSFGTALETDTVNGGVTRFKQVSLETLVDSPILASRYFQSIDLDTNGPAPVRLDVAADHPELLKASPQMIGAHRALVQQAYKLFGSHHYAHYDFLLALTDELPAMGLEHHQSSEDVSVPGYFAEWDKTGDIRDLVAHEFTHSWNGKFRRPFDLWTPNYNVPMHDTLLWVYEGQTQYWGIVLAARSGLLSKQQALDAIASTAAGLDHHVGRVWRDLQDTTNDPIMSSRRALSSRSWQRAEDYYGEGLLIWLDADTLIRDLSHGTRSLDNFARAFFGIDNGSVGPVTYTFEDVVKALNAVQPYDWAGFLRTRLDGHGPGAPLDGLSRGGYKLVYGDTPTDYTKLAQARRKQTDLSYSVGLLIGADGKIADVQRDSVADKAALTVGTQILAVNGMAYDGDRLNDAIGAAATSSEAIELIVKNSNRFRTVRLNYHDGLRYPRLERIGDASDRLDQILTAK
ncbi:MAG: M61 family peptidase [Rhodospirillaceae bacterium]|nr:MAG: M61 family peptidase [Rhodospirillaceae bacterium]